MKPIGIIGGSGFYDLLEDPRMFIHDNCFGRSSEIYEGEVEGRHVYFIPRHGPEHTIIVPRINYRANIWAFKELGVERIISTNSVGSINPQMPPGDLVVPDDFYDATRRMPRSLYDDTVVAIHVDMTPPFCPQLRHLLIEGAQATKPGHVHDHGVLFVSEGLRMETPFEYRLYRKLGGDLVGMTSLPEAVLAREAAMCYATICVPVNFGGFGEPVEPTTFHSILRESVEEFKSIVRYVIKHLDLEKDCGCLHALDGAVLAKED